ncbi:MAG: ribonuclease E/G, partial [Terracidiphilus sp.]
MAKEICISSTPHETRLAILEDDQLAEIYYERENEYTLAGSIYNGRVTRVLPGMQSAFVDLGLERDAFLYVTDFIQLEDQEETDELERAAASGAGQAPREIRRGNGTERGGAEPGRSEEQKGARGSRGRRPGGRNDIPRSEERETNEGAPEAAEAAPMALEIAPVAGPQEGSGEEAGEGSGAAGGKRWRGRRHHRGRGPAPRTDGQPQTQTGAADAAGASEAPEEPEIAPNIHAAAHPAENAPEPRGRAPREPRGGAAPAPFVLPGESLSKYGGAPTVETPEFTPNPAAPPRPSGFSKPSTLVDAPLGWDGSGLLPGESLSRHRRNRPEPEPGPETEPETGLQSEPSALEVESIEDRLETALRPEPETVDENGAKDVFPELDEDLPVAEALHFEPEHESDLAAAAAAPKEAADAEAENPVAERAPLAAALEEDGPGAVEQTEMSHPENDEAGKPDEDASASHRVDPAAPTGFRIFGMGGKKKGEEPPAAQPAPSPATVTAVSAFAPGEGAVEEELIEGEEFETAPHHRRHKAEEGDFDDYEEQTLASQIQSGGLGEMLQEAHLDHKIQLDFDDKNGEDEDLDVAEEEEEEQPSAEAQPTPGKPRQDRGGRARRGRGAQPQGNRRGGPSRRSMQTTDLPVISDLLKPGQEILVQIAKEPMGKKGARITSHIALPGRFLVFMPTVAHVGVSRKIASDDERLRLRRILVHERGEASGGFIVRTAAEGASEEDLRADLRFLMNLWNEIKQRSDSSKSPALIYHDLSLIERILRDQVSSNFSNIWVDSHHDYERIVRFINRFSPSLVRRVKLYT